ncbi:ParB/RepB/Spo0J family partition protein [Streptomyces sp. NPDC047515]|uniref:ParB/RepB/Spo0J family partition protein n=1 Tax=Streptomyces sp. NPDC047515 TaxID=3155380 RepID=UPI0033CA990A
MVTKSEQFAQSSAFSRAGGARSARRNAIENIGQKPTPTELPVGLISQNPDNPRDHLRNLDDMTETVRHVGVVNAITVATIDAYLDERPDRAGALDPGATHLVIDGHRRLEAARRVGLDTIKVTVDDALVSTDESLLEAAFVSNYHRDGMTELEEAIALEKLVKFYGGQAKAAQRLGMGQSTISSKLSFLKLSPELQADLAAGRRTGEQLRNLGKLNPEEQRAQADARAEEARRRAAKASKPVQPEPSLPESEPQNYHAVIIAAPDAPSSAESAAAQQLPAEPSIAKPAYTAVYAQPSPTAPSPVVDEPVRAPEAPSRALPEPRAQLTPVPAETASVVPAKPPVAERPPVKMPWYDGRAAMDIIFRKLSTEERRNAMGRYFELVGGAEAAAADLKAAASPQFRELLADHLMDGV